MCLMKLRKRFTHWANNNAIKIHDYQSGMAIINFPMLDNARYIFQGVSSN